MGYITFAFRATFAVVLFCVGLWVLGALDAFITNPIITTYTLGWYIQTKATVWGFGGIGFILLITYEVAIAISTLGFFAWLFNLVRGNIRSFGRRGGR